MREFRPFTFPVTASQEIKARRWLFHAIMGMFYRAHRLENEHYRHCGEFYDK